MPFLIPFFVDVLVDKVSDVGFGVWGVDVVGVDVWGEAMGGVVMVVPFFAKRSASSLPWWLLCAFIQLRSIGL